MASVTIMASVTYGKCDLCQVLLMANVILAKIIMANETEPQRLDVILYLIF